MELKEQVVVVTGASGGIGEAIARELAAEGCQLVLNGRDATKLNAVVDSLPGAIGVVGDLATDATVAERMLADGLAAFGRVDVLVNNAGMMTVGAAEEIDLDKVQAMLRLNVEALIATAYRFVRYFKGRGAGFVVNLGSIAGLKMVATHAAYNASKFAVEAFSDSLRVELAGSGVRVSSVAPGTVATNLYAGWKTESKDFVFSGGALSPQDVARSVRFVLEQPKDVLIARMLVVPAAQPV